MTDEPRAICTMPAVTEREAKVLFIWHLQMASHLFELLPDGFQIPKDSFDDFSIEAAKDFLSRMEEAYDVVPPEEGDDGC